MDNLTNILVGVALARLLFKKRVAYATTAMIVAVNLPDLDVLYSWPGIRYIEYHRGLLDSLVMIPVWGLIVAIGLRWVVRKYPPKRQPGSNGRLPVPGWGAAFALGAVAVGAHVFLDWTTAYGVRLFAPFNNTWYAANWMPAWDPFVWLLLAAFLGLPMLLGLINHEVGEVGRNPHRFSAALGLVLLAGWMGVRARAHDNVLDRLNTRSVQVYYQDELPLDWEAMPQSYSPFVWQAVINLPSAYVVGEVNEPWNPAYGRFLLQRIFLKPPRVPAIDNAEQTATAKTFLQFARFPLETAEIPDSDAPRIVTFTDMRFVNGVQRPAMHAFVTMTSGMQIVGQGFTWRRGQ